MLCKWCQIKVARNCVRAIGGMVPMNALGCDFENLCNVEEYSKRIISIFQPERASEEDTEMCMRCSEPSDESDGVTQK